MQFFAIPAAAVVLAASLSATSARAEGDAKAGAKVYRKCAVCHAIDPGKNKIGPSLHGVFGRKAGAAPGYRFSPAMQKANLTWTAENLDRYLQNPRQMVKGTRMAFAGLRSKKEREDVIAYLKTLK